MSTERLLGTYASLMAVGMSIFLQRKIQTRALLSHLNTVHPQPQKQKKSEILLIKLTYISVNSK